MLLGVSPLVLKQRERPEGQVGSNHRAMMVCSNRYSAWKARSTVQGTRYPLKDSPWCSIASRFCVILLFTEPKVRGTTELKHVYEGHRVPYIQAGRFLRCDGFILTSIYPCNRSYCSTHFLTTAPDIISISAGGSCKVRGRDTTKVGYPPVSCRHTSSVETTSNALR